MGKTIKDKKTKNPVIKVAIVTIIVNFVLTAFKLLAGIFGNSKAMISDSIHSGSDVLSTFVVIIGVLIAGRKADKNHRYGHERLECVVTIIIAIMLFAVGGFLGYDGISSIVKGSYKDLAAPGGLALAAAITSIVVKEGMYWYTYISSKRLDSLSLKADAWHHRSDALSSVGSLLGIGGAMLGFPIADTIASIIICVFILKVAIDIFKDSVDKMVDKSCDEETESMLKAKILSVSGVLGIDDIKTRMFSNKIYVDVEISVDRLLTVEAAHDIAQTVHDRIEKEVHKVKHCMVHVNPSRICPQSDGGESIDDEETQPPLSMPEETGDAPHD